MIKSKITHLFGVVLSLLMYSNMVQAGGGIQLGLSNTYIVGAIYSLSSVDGTDLQTDSEKGYVHTRLALHYEEANSASVLDLFGQVGRFVLENNRMGVSIGIRPLAGQTKDKDAEKDEVNYGDNLSILELSIGAQVRLTSWLAEGLKLNSSAYYYLSPQVVSFGDFQGSSMKGVRVSLPVFATSELYLSYDNLSGRLKENKGGKDLDIINTFSLGIRLGL